MNTDEMMSDGLVTVAEAAKFLSLGRSTLYELMDRGDLQYVKIGSSRRIPKRLLVSLAAANLKGGWKLTGDKT